MSPERLEQLVETVRSIPDQRSRDAALELVQAVMELHRTAIERMMELVTQSEDGGAICDGFANDAAIGGVLLLHDLHPLDLETRVRRAVEHPSLALRGGDARVASVNRRVVRVRVSGGGPSFEAEVRKAILEAAPDADEIAIESTGTAAAGFVPIEQLLAR